jgi:hypothetical protein
LFAEHAEFDEALQMEMLDAMAPLAMLTPKEPALLVENLQIARKLTWIAPSL